MKCCLLLASWFFFPIGMLLFMFLFVCYASVFFFIKERCNYLSSLMPIFRRLCVVVQSHTLMIFFFVIYSGFFYIFSGLQVNRSIQWGGGGSRVSCLKATPLTSSRAGASLQNLLHPALYMHLLHCLCQNMALRRPGRQCYLSVLPNILQEGKYFLKI